MELKCKPLLVSCRVILHNSTNAKTTQIIKYKLLFQMQIFFHIFQSQFSKTKESRKDVFFFLSFCFCLEAPIHGNTLQLLFLGRIHI